MASKNKKFNVKHMGGNVDRKESEQVTKDYEVRELLCALLDDFWLDTHTRARSEETDLCYRSFHFFFFFRISFNAT